MNKRLAILLAALAALVSCSVKEDRSRCPVLLYVPEGFNAHRLSGSCEFYAYEDGCGRLSQCEYGDLASLRSGWGPLSVSKGETCVAFVGGAVNMKLASDSLLVIPYGCQADAAVAARDHFETYAERWNVRDSLFRQYARMTVRMLSPQYSVRVKGTWCGFALRSLRPIAGDFCYVPVNRGDGVFEANLPRQGDDSLLLEVWGSDSSGGSSRLLDTLPLGQYVSLTGYDWTARDLGPVEVALDFVRSTVSITVNDWTEVYKIIVTI